MIQTKAERRAYQKAYRLAHKAKRQAYNKMWRAEHKAETQAYSKIYNATHEAERKADRAARRIAGYGCWKAMIQRCTNPNNTDWFLYGGMGVKICDRWRYGENGKSGFKCFIEDLGPRPSFKHSISRHGDVGNYEPGNCEWSDKNFPVRPRTAQHGDPGMYNRGFRCDVCRKAHNERARQRLAKMSVIQLEAHRKARREYDQQRYAQQEMEMASYVNR
jgi:hypothetical protein